MKKLNFVILPTIENSKNYIAVNQVFDNSSYFSLEDHFPGDEYS